jgi:signal transduction histidine kinase
VSLQSPFISLNLIWALLNLKRLLHNKQMTNYIGHWFSHLQVQQKIAWGYGLSLGIAIAGTSLGIVLSDQQQRQANALTEDVIEELGIITHLQVDVLQTLTEQQHIEEWLSHPTRLQKHYIELRESHHHFQQSWEQFKRAEGGTKGQEAFEREGEVEALQAFLKKYEGIPEAYIHALDQLLTKLELAASKPEDLVHIRTSLIELEQSSLATQMETFAAELTTIRDSITQEDYENAELAISSSNTLRLWVIGVSMSGSVAIAIILSILTSRAIAHPIQSLTKVTQQALNQSNFDLQAPVMTQDEVGTLAVSFNQLIASVKKLLDQQQEYSLTLEKKVAERTQELSNKNIQLQALLQQLHSTQMQMVQSEKMSSLGQLVAGVAHEVNNPVNFIHANLVYLRQYTHRLLKFVQLYQKHYPDPVSEIKIEAEDMDLDFLQEDLPNLLNSMQIGTERIREIVIALRNFSRIDEAEFKTVNIHEGIDSTLLILHHRLKARPERPEIRVIRDFGNLPDVECYPGQLNQVLMNILTNAIDALEERIPSGGARSAIATVKDNLQPEQPALNDRRGQIEIRTSVVDSQWIEIAIADNGSGMTETVQKQIFNPFFTTKPVGKGTGMGMAISYQIVTEKHRGKFECFSTAGVGTEFIIQIPIKQLAQAA